jgi:threonine dehydratase
VLDGKLPTAADIEAAAQRLGANIRRTPVFHLTGAELGVEGDVALKLELTQHTGSFKARGALNSIAALPAAPAGVVAASGGNHGAAVAWAAAQAGAAADIFLPATSPASKAERVRSYGATAHVVEGYYPDALLAAQRWIAERSSGGDEILCIHAYDGFDTVCGQGSVGLEIAEQVPAADFVLVGCGGGGLFAGVATALAGRCDVVPVEPRRCANLHAALAAGHPVPVEVGGVAADSLGAAETGAIAYAVAAGSDVEPAMVGDDDILAARLWLWEHCRLLAEPGACAALAAVTAGVVPVRRGETAVVVISGGNHSTLPYPASHERRD